jgi:hypothetical protein
MATTTRQGRRWWSVMVAGACFALVVGCSAGAPTGAPPAPPGGPGGTAQPAPHGMSPGEPGAGEPGASGALTNTAGESPADKALQLEALFGQHSVLAADLMRGRIRGDDDFGQAANAAITRNTDDMVKVVGSLVGDQGANALRLLWSDHVTALFNYSRGLATNDAAVRDDAKAHLVTFENGLADLLASASQGRLPRAAARDAVQAHVDHLTQQADAYAAKDYARADALYREGYAHTFDIGHTVAAALLPPDQAGALQQPTWRLRSALDRLLGEHVALAVGALRAGGTNSPDFPAAADALNGNTSDLSAAMGTLFGAQAGQQFMTLWADHVDQLVAYTAGVAANDPARKDAALAKLRDFEGRLAAFLDTATGSTVHSADLAKAFLAHDEMLTQQVDAFAGRDYPRAHDLAYTTYQDMFGLSGKLANAFGETVAARLPQGGARTGAGGTASTAGAVPGSR